MKCRLCHSESESSRCLEVREMALGTREPFTYHLCGACGSLQLANVPGDLSRYYPQQGYYAYRQGGRGLGSRLGSLAAAAWHGAALLAPEPVLRVLSAVPEFGSRMRTNRLRPLRGQGMTRASRILDVGGAVGELLGFLRHLGFRNLTCVDPFTPLSGTHDGIRFIQGKLADVDETFDVIMYHHVLEHVLDLDAEFRTARQRLAPGGFMLVRMPLLPNEAFATYGPNWVQIDAPRHIHIPSRSAFRLVAERCGLQVVAAGDDSQEFQFCGSEDYARNITRPESAYLGAGNRGFLRKELRASRRRADQLNREHRGDQGWFILRSRVDVPSDASRSA